MCTVLAQDQLHAEFTDDSLQYSACHWDSGSVQSQNWWLRTYIEDADGNQKAIADVCWSGGGYDLGPQDYYVAECLANLHVEQAFTCIERVGSVCDGPESANTAIATMRVIYGASGNPNQQIDNYNRDKMIYSLKKVMENTDKGFDLNQYIYVAPRYDEGDITYWNGIFYGSGQTGHIC
jgi:hypothetical protein